MSSVVMCSKGLIHQHMHFYDVDKAKKIEKHKK